MISLDFNSGDIAELLFAFVLILLGLGMLVVRSTKHRRRRFRAQYLQEPCSHPAWRACSLRVRGEGQALALRCFRCNAPALDRFKATLCSDGALAITNLTGSVQILVINGTMHEIYPYDAAPDAVDGELLVYLNHADLRKA